MVLAANSYRRQSFSVDSLAISSRIADTSNQSDIGAEDSQRLENNKSESSHRPGNNNNEGSQRTENNNSESLQRSEDNKSEGSQHPEDNKSEDSQRPEDNDDEDIDVVSQDEKVFGEGNDNIVNLLRRSAADDGCENANITLSSLSPNSTSTPKPSSGKRRRQASTLKTPSSSDDSRADDSRGDSRANDDMVTDESMRSESVNSSHEKHSPVLTTSSAASSDLETESVSEDEPRSSRKKARTAFNGDQLRELETRYKTQKYLTAADRVHMARTLNLKDQQIKTWFQNRRMKEKRHLRDKEQSQCFSLPTGGVEVAQLAALGICTPPGGQQLGSMSPLNYHFTNTASPNTRPAAAAFASNSTSNERSSSGQSDRDTGADGSNSHPAVVSSPYTAYRNALTDRYWNGANFPLYPSLYNGTQFGLLQQLPALERSRYLPYFGSSAPV